MPDIRRFDQATREYFDSLPKFVQEDIMQSDLEIQCREDLEAFVDNFCDGCEQEPDWE